MSPTLAVVSQTGETLSFFDLDTKTRTHHLTHLPSEPHELCYDSKRNLLYISHTYEHGHFWKHGNNSHEISIVDLNSRNVIGKIDTLPAKAPHGLVLSPSQDILYVSVEELPDTEGGGVIAIDLNSKSITKQVASQYRSHWMAVTPDGRKAYTCNKDAPFISVLNLESDTMTKIDVPSCEEPSMSKDGQHVFFPTPGFVFGKNPAEPKILVIDTSTDEIVNTIIPDTGAISVYVTSTGDILVGQYHFAEGETMFGSDNQSSSAKLSWYDGKTFEKKGEAPIGLFPLTVRSSADGTLGFAANVVHGTVSVIDLTTGRTVTTLEVDNKKRGDKPVHVGAHGLAFIP